MAMITGLGSLSAAASAYGSRRRLAGISAAEPIGV